MLSVALIANALWFGAGFWHFVFKAPAASFGLASRANATQQGRAGLIGALRFLGGLNLALAAGCVMLVIHLYDVGRVTLMIAFATYTLAHASQFAVNAPVAWRELRGRKGPWRVLRGPMLLIFIVDGVLAVIDGIAWMVLAWPG